MNTSSQKTDTITKSVKKTPNHAANCRYENPEAKEAKQGGIEVATARSPPVSPLVVISFDTDHEPLRIARKAGGNFPRFDLLPFLNLLIDHLLRNGWADTHLAPLLEFSVFYRVASSANTIWVTRYGCRQYWVMPYLFAFCHYISNFPYPAVWWVVVFCILVSCLIFLTHNSRLELWKEGKIDKILQEISLVEPQL